MKSVISTSINQSKLIFNAFNEFFKIYRSLIYEDMLILKTSAAGSINVIHWNKVFICESDWITISNRSKCKNWKTLQDMLIGNLQFNTHSIMPFININYDNKDVTSNAARINMAQKCGRKVKFTQLCICVEVRSIDLLGVNVSVATIVLRVYAVGAQSWCYGCSLIDNKSTIA
jgi:hypothetical protein